MIRSRVSSMPTLCIYRVMGVVDASMVFPIRRASHCTAIKTDTKHIDIRAADIYLCVQWIVAGYSNQAIRFLLQIQWWMLQQIE